MKDLENEIYKLEASLKVEICYSSTKAALFSLLIWLNA